MTSQDQLPPASDSSNEPLTLAERLRTNPFWAAVILSGAAFAVTCLVSVAATLGDPHGPMNQVVTVYGMHAIAMETVILMISGLGAMTVDRIQTLHRQARERRAIESLNPRN